MPETLKKLAALQEEAGDKAAAARSLTKINYIYPLKDEAMHSKLGELSMALGKTPEAIRDSVVGEVAAFVNGQPQHDDITMVILKFEDPRA